MDNIISSLGSTDVEDFGNGLEPLAAPNFASAADNHNVAAGGSWLDSIGNTLESVSNAPKFWGLAIASGFTGILNSGIAVGNWISQKTTGTDLTSEINLKQWVSEYDDDFGKYYRENADSIDTWGFIATSIIPGTAGIKALNLAQKSIKVTAETGILGRNLALSTALRTPAAETYIARAATNIAASSERNIFLRTDTLRAIGSGFGQQALEAAAFETAVLATSFKSPFFDDMDISDILINSALGVVIGGGVGGILGIPGINKAIKTQVKSLDELGRVGMTTTPLPQSVASNYKIANSFLNREVAEQYITRAEAGVQPGQALPEGATAEVIAKQVSSARNNIRQINNDIRTEVHNLMSPGSKAVGNEFADAIISLDSRQGTNLIIGAEEIMRVSDAPIIRAPKIPGQMSLSLEGAAVDASAAKIQWNKLWGDGAGQSFEDVPRAAELADTVKLKRGETIQDAVNRVAKSFKHTHKRGVNVVDTGTNLAEVQSRYLWAARSKLEGPQTILDTDLPHLEAALKQWSNVGSVRIVDKTGKTIDEVSSSQYLQDLLVKNKTNLAKRALTRKNSTRNIDDIAQRLNMNPGLLRGDAVNTGSKLDDYMYRQSQAAKLNKTEEEIFFTPSYMGVRQGGISGLDDMAIDAESLIVAQRKAAQSVIDNAVENAGRYMGQMQLTDPATGGIARVNHTRALPSAEEVMNIVADTNRFGSGSRLFTFANGNYGSAESAFQYIGQIKRQMDLDGMAVVREQLESPLTSLRSNLAGAAEVSAINERLASMPIRFGLDDSSQRLVPIQHLDDIANGRELSNLPPGVPNEIVIRDPGAYEVISKHIQLNGKRTEGITQLRAAQGLENNIDVRGYYPIKPNPRDYQYHAFVVDDTLTGAGKKTMIHARTASQLDQMINRVQQEFPNYNIIRKDQSEAYHKALGDFEYDKTLHDNYIDTSLASRGINSQFLPQTNPNLVADKFLNFHLNQTRAYNADLITTKYEAAFRALTDLGREFGGLATSRYTNAGDLAAGVKNNPYAEYMKTALNISNLSEYTWLTNINQYLDSAVSKVWNSASDLFRSVRGVDKNELDTVNRVFEEAGFRTAYYDAATHLLANHPAGNNQLSKFIRGANSVLATAFLRLDWLNAINNKLGSTILTSTELRHIVNGIKRADVDSVGKLTALSEVRVPGTDSSILSPNKLMMNSLKNFWGPNSKQLLDQYKSAGWITDLAQQTRGIVDDLTLTGNESASILNKKLATAVDKAKKAIGVGEKITGNKFVEELNRFLSADIMRQITDIAQGAGIISPSEARSYINTFVNRTQVNLNAAQRPLAFQGPIGMAMGLFQSYQFNLMQQLFRYVAPGARKDAAFLMGMQGSVYGLNGLPGFQAFNEHIIGQASGNYEHKDITQAVNQAAGYDLANFFLYGIPSNLLRANLYSRGDLTPQHPTILPSNINDLPFVSMYSRVLGNLWNTTKGIAGGGDIWNTFLTGVEHNSINRPLAGMAQTLRGLRNGNVYSTDRNGNILSTNDLFSLSTLARLAGGKPLDEAIVRDEKYRISMYRQADLDRRNSAARNLRLALQDNGEASGEQLENMFNIYLETGGKTAQFNRWMMNQYTKANVSDTEKIRNMLSTPYAQRMQLLMGGAEDAGVSFSLN